MFKRALSATSALLKPSTPSTPSTVPLRRTKDPLLASSTAQHFVLPSGSHFIVRPPPSALPPTVPIPQASTSATHPFLAAVASPAGGPSLLPALTTAEHLLPPSRGPSSSPSTPSKTLSAAEIAELQALRRERPAYWTRSRLAARFGVSPNVVGRFGWGEGPEARRAEQARRAAVEGKQERREGSWGWKKSIAREERRRRRSMW
ncbi:hypothetical protein JCM21900_002439 [Sporobolomyces salmonicolor]